MVNIEKKAIRALKTKLEKVFTVSEIDEIEWYVDESTDDSYQWTFEVPSHGKKYCWKCNYSTKDILEEWMIVGKKIIRGSEIIHASSGRIKKNERKDKLFYYDIRHNDEDGMDPVTLEQAVLVNHFATIGVSKPIDFGDEDFIDLSEDEKSIIYASL